MISGHRAAMTHESQTLHFALDRSCGILDHTLSHPIRTSLPPFAAPIDRRPSSLAIAALCGCTQPEDEQEQDWTHRSQHKIALPLSLLVFNENNQTECCGNSELDLAHFRAKSAISH